MSAALRFRLTIDGEVVADELVHHTDPVEAIATRHHTLTELADERGSPWLLEIIDPDGIIPTLKIRPA